MNWEKLTAPDFHKAVKKVKGVCLLPIGVVEKHGDHLPLGQDYLYIHALCTEVAKVEPAMVFPPFYLGKINEGRHKSGTIAIDYSLIIPILESLCDEISRNGLKKIIIINGHGGNNSVIPAFAESLLDKDKDYMVFHHFPFFIEGERELLKAKRDGHAGEGETSCALLHFPELVKSDTAAAYGTPLKRMEGFAKLGLKTNIDWYARFPGHLAGDQTPGSAKTGKALDKLRIAKIADMIRLVKKDDTPFTLYKELRAKAKNPEP